MPTTVSVIMTVYNGERYLRQAIDSVLVQTFSDWELIVINDGSIDSTDDILRSYSDSRITKLSCEVNRKQAVCSNQALSLATGRYIARLDADDVSLPTRLAEQVNYMETHPSVVLVASAAYEIDGEGSRTGFRPGGLGECGLKLTLTANNNPIVHSSVVFRADTARKLHGYNEDAHYWFSEDYEFLSRIALSGEATILSQPLVEYRVHPSSVSACNQENQDHFGQCIARKNLEGLIRRVVDDKAWSAWWRFVMTKPGRAVAFDVDEVRSLSSLLLEMVRKVSHSRNGRCTVPRLWAKHALALAWRRGNRITPNVRVRFAFMALRCWAVASNAHW